MFVDSHCHLSDPGLVDQMQDLLQAMANAQVDRALCICTTMKDFEAVRDLAQSHDNLWATVGVHPDQEDEDEPDVDLLCARAAQARVVAIGETGLDYYRLNGRSVADMEWQRNRFRTHIQAARRTGKPLVVHTRDSAADTLRLLREEGDGQVTGVFHCFTENDDVARAALDLGFYISFSGILTFKNAQALRNVAAWVPLERCLIETDSPYLAPVPHRGKFNQPAYVPFVAQALAAVKGISLAEVARATSNNFEELFGLSTAA